MDKKPKIRFKGFDDAWEQRKFGDCVLIQRGGSPRPMPVYFRYLSRCSLESVFQNFPENPKRNAR